MEATVEVPVQQVAAPIRKKYRFLLICGKHVNEDGVQSVSKLCNGDGALNPEWSEGKEVVHTDFDLTGFDRQGFPAKFRRLGDSEDPNIIGLSPTAMVFDPAVETLDQFTERVKRREAESKLSFTPEAARIAQLEAEIARLRSSDVARAAERGFRDAGIKKPVASMSLQELQDFCDSREISYAAETTAAELVDALHELKYT